MAQLQALIEGEQENIWGAILNANLAALNGELIATTQKANSAATPAQVTAAATAARDAAIAATTTPAQARNIAQQEIAASLAGGVTPAQVTAAANQARSDAIAASEPRIPRAGAASGSAVVLLESGGLGFGAAPGGGGGGGSVGDATVNAKGVVQLAGHLGGSASAPQISDAGKVATLALLGSWNNPIRDPAAARPTYAGWYRYYWAVPFEPANAMPQDHIELTGLGKVGTLTSTGKTGSSVTIQAPALTGAATYRFQRRLASSTIESDWTTSATQAGLTHEYTGLTASTAYSFRVVPLDSNGVEGTASDTLNVTTNAAAAALYTANFNTDLGGWTANSNCTLVRATDRAVFPSGAAKLTSVGTAWPNGMRIQRLQPGPLVGGQLMTVKFKYSMDFVVGQRWAAVIVNWTNNGGYEGFDFMGTVDDDLVSGAGATEKTYTLMVPVNINGGNPINGVDLTIEVANCQGAGEVCWIDDITVSQ